MKRFALLAAASLLAALLSPIPGDAVSALPETTEILVKFRGDPAVKLVRLADASEAGRLLRNLERQRALVEYVEPNARFSAARAPDDPLYGEQWALPAINAPSAWELTTGSTDVLVAVLDTGVDVDHPDLAAAIATNRGEAPGNGLDDDANGFVDDVLGWDFVANVADPSPKFDGTETVAATNHGTVVAGIIAAVGNNGVGVSGTAWSIRLLPLRVLNGAGSGDTLAVARGIDYAVQRGAKAINLSLVGPSNSQTLETAIANARAAGVVVLAAAGNDGIDLNESPQYPVCTSGVIGVAALTEQGARAGFSNYGSDCVDLAAPGENITSTGFEDASRGYVSAFQSGWFGTSVATPFVSGVAALVASAQPDFTRLQLEEAVIGSAAAVAGDASVGAGRVDAAAAVGVSAAALPSPEHILTLPGPGGGPQVRIVTASGTVRGQFFAADKSYRGGGSIAAGDLDGDGKDEIVYGSGRDTVAIVRIFNQAGKLQRTIRPYGSTFRGGVNVAVGDVDGNDTTEIITGTGAGGGPQVRVFDAAGKVLGQFFAYAKSFRGGVNVAIGDVDGNGTPEIVTGPGAGGGPQVRVFSGRGRLIRQFFAFDRSDHAGISIASGDVNADGRADIIVGRLDGTPTVRLFDRLGKRLGELAVFPTGFLGGVSVAASDVNADGVDEIVVSTARGAPQIRVFTLDGKVLGQFFAYAKSFRGGVRVAGIR